MFWSIKLAYEQAQKYRNQLRMDKLMISKIFLMLLLNIFLFAKNLRAAEGAIGNIPVLNDISLYSWDRCSEPEYDKKPCEGNPRARIKFSVMARCGDRIYEALVLSQGKDSEYLENVELVIFESLKNDSMNYECDEEPKKHTHDLEIPGSYKYLFFKFKLRNQIGLGTN